ncbi:MAG: hypothetical protein K2X66_09320, partial [Cyanobacteria bacterium]|nr:hypothetical protein [Cyanobacteriota bacterium]
FRHVVHTGSLEGVGEAAVQGAVGGAILSPVIGGGLHIAGRGAGKIVKYTMKPKSPALPAEAVHVEGTPQASSQTASGTSGTSHPLPEQAPPADYLKQKGQLDFIKDPVLKIKETPSAGMPIMKDMHQMAKHDPALQAALDKRGPEVLGILSEPGFSPTDQSALFRRGAEKGGVSSGKMCQILADDPTLAPNLRAQMEKMKSQGTPSRTQVQAQEAVNQLYGPGKYTVENVLGVGTVGEVWLVKTADGRQQVLKMIKDGVTLKSLEEEEIIWKAFVKSAHKDNPAVRDRSLVMVDRLFKGWKEELDFKIEHQGAEALGKGAKRYDVAKPRDIAFVEEGGGVQRGVSIVYDMAPGIKMDTLVEMLKVFKENPLEYQTRYAKEIGKHPWLKDPNAWSKDLATGYLASQNEQALFTSRAAGRTSHGDPHTGNFFVTHENGKLKWTYIDTGLTVTRTPQEVTHHLTMMSDMLLGNSKGLAKKLIAKAESIPLSLDGKPVTRRELEQQLGKLLKERIYESGVDYRDMSTVKRIMDNTLEELGIIQSAQDAVFLKSQLQVLQTYEDLAKVTGMNPKDILARSMPDISKGLWGCFRQRPGGTLVALKDTVFEFLQHPIKSLRILSKFRPDNSPS